MAKAIVVGKEERPYTDKQTGEVKTFRKLHLLMEASRRVEDGFTGQKVQTEAVSFPVDDVTVGAVVDLDYEVIPTSKGTYARLVDVIVLGHIDTKAFHSSCALKA